LTITVRNQNRHARSLSDPYSSCWARNARCSTRLRSQV
jgi:hypothetical protein